MAGLTENLRASNRILSASRSTASCSSPKVFTQAVAPQEAVRTYSIVQCWAFYASQDTGKAVQLELTAGGLL